MIDNRKTCPGCKGSVSAELPNCPHCGFRFGELFKQYMKITGQSVARVERSDG
jgi:RNA polymerase subunit RPABC4/transcription elongation factor Spt4